MSCVRPCCFDMLFVSSHPLLKSAMNNSKRSVGQLKTLRGRPGKQMVNSEKPTGNQKVAHRRLSALIESVTTFSAVFCIAFEEVSRCYAHFCFIQFVSFCDQGGGTSDAVVCSASCLKWPRWISSLSPHYRNSFLSLTSIAFFEVDFPVFVRNVTDGCCTPRDKGFIML